MPTRRDKSFQVRVDEETLEGAKDYAADHGVSLGAIVRALMKMLVKDPPADLDFLPDIDEETQPAEYRPRARKKRARK